MSGLILSFDSDSDFDSSSDSRRPVSFFRVVFVSLTSLSIIFI